MQPTYSEIFAALGEIDTETLTLLESLVTRGVLSEQTDSAAQELIGHAYSIADRLAERRLLEDDADRYSVAEFTAALRAEIDAKKRKTPICPPTLAAFESYLALHGVESAAA